MTQPHAGDSLKWASAGTTSETLPASGPDHRRNKFQAAPSLEILNHDGMRSTGEPNGHLPQAWQRAIVLHNLRVINEEASLSVEMVTHPVQRAEKFEPEGRTGKHGSG